MPANRIKIDNSILKRYRRQSARHKKREVVVRILIVCEGSKTEPQYFEAFKRKKNGVFVFDADIHGEGKNTLSLVDRAIELIKAADRNGIPYDVAWVVFDRDSFPARRFNAAIQKAEANDICAAWSNEAFELWFLYHFQNRVTAMSRSEYKNAISEAVNKSPKYKDHRRYTYSKNSPDTFDVVNRYGSEQDALRWAELGASQFTGKDFATHNPCTMVFKLIRQLEGKDPELNEYVKRKMNE